MPFILIVLRPFISFDYWRIFGDNNARLILHGIDRFLFIVLEENLYLQTA